MTEAGRSPELVKAYRECRAIAKREAKNFYYGFLALPPAKRDAMCAMYAFMRRADDIADDESETVPERRELLARWLAGFHAEATIGREDERVFLAVRDVQQKYCISDALLGQLVEGTAMDLLPAPPAGVHQVMEQGRVYDVYEQVEALEVYCYLVASVVGLVTIRVFGFAEPKAEEYAVQLGKAFQFTNILRDVKEDAERGRVYLPEDLLHASGSSLGALVSATQGGVAAPPLIASLRELGRRAEEFYRSAEGLIPLLQADSRAAMRVLVGIYRALLDEVKGADYQVFAGRLRVSTPKKVAILLRGLLGRRTGAG